MGKAVIFVGVIWAAVVSAFLGMDDDRTALGLLALLTIPATAAIVVFMITEHKRHMARLNAQVSHERI